jgi:hypothetical protein
MHLPGWHFDDFRMLWSGVEKEFAAFDYKALKGSVAFLKRIQRLASAKKWSKDEEAQYTKAQMADLLGYIKRRAADEAKAMQALKALAS